jgi:hypothetical protein
MQSVAMARFRYEKTMRRISRMERIHLGKRFDFALVLSEKTILPLQSVESVEWLFHENVHLERARQIRLPICAG